MEKIIGLRSIDEQRILFGPRDRNLRLVRDHFRIRIMARRGELRLEGADDRVMEAYLLLVRLLDQTRRDGELDPEDVERALYGADLTRHRFTPQVEPDTSSPQRRDVASKRHQTPIDTLGEIGGNGHVESDSGKYARPLTEGQARYLDAIRDNDLVFATGPAGTGKTFLATAMAVEALNRGQVRKLVLVRPAVEAGEKLGFLPGDFQAKVNPYLRPIFDALGSLLSYSAMRRYMERDVIEIAPLAYMRGRTLEGAFIILDEAQNTTPNQMMMFLTRMGRSSKVVVTGDVTQVDLPMNVHSGLVDALRVLKNVPGVAMVELHESDIVRHGLVAKIVQAYEAADSEASVPLTRDTNRPTRFAGGENGGKAKGKEKEETGALSLPLSTVPTVPRTIEAGQPPQLRFE